MKPPDPNSPHFDRQVSEALHRDLDRYRSDPEAFAWELLGVPCTPQMSELFRRFRAKKT